MQTSTSAGARAEISQKLEKQTVNTFPRERNETESHSNFKREVYLITGDDVTQNTVTVPLATFAERLPHRQITVIGLKVQALQALRIERYGDKYDN